MIQNKKGKPSPAFTKVFLSAPQYNPSNSGKGEQGNYKREYNKTERAKASKERQA